MNTIGTSLPPSRLLVAIAFAAVYVIWGSTYLAIRVVVESMPPFWSAGIRFVTAGAVLLGVLRLKGVPFPTRHDWGRSFLTGTLLLVLGNGLVVWAEQSLPSGQAALLVALAPVWFATLEWVRPKGRRPEMKTIVGVAVGLLGVIALVRGRPGDASAEGSGSRYAALAVLVAGISWAGGSLYSKHSPSGASPWMNAASQMLAGGVGLLVLGTADGEWARTNWSHVTMRSIWALAYLIVFGSWIAFSAYVWLLKVSAPGKVATYAYVNPVIAVFLGWFVLHERVNSQMLWAALIVLSGVIIITVPGSLLFRASALLRPGRRIRPTSAAVTN